MTIFTSTNYRSRYEQVLQLGKVAGGHGKRLQEDTGRGYGDVTGNGCGRYWGEVTGGYGKRLWLFQKDLSLGSAGMRGCMQSMIQRRPKQSRHGSTRLLQRNYRKRWSNDSGWGRCQSMGSRLLAAMSFTFYIILYSGQAAFCSQDGYWIWVSLPLSVASGGRSPQVLYLRSDWQKRPKEGAASQIWVWICCGEGEGILVELCHCGRGRCCGTTLFATSFRRTGQAWPNRGMQSFELCDLCLTSKGHRLDDANASAGDSHFPRVTVLSYFCALPRHGSGPPVWFCVWQWLFRWSVFTAAFIDRRHSSEISHSAHRL